MSNAAGMTRVSARSRNGFRYSRAKRPAPTAATEHEPGGCHPPEPVGGNQLEMLTVEGPFVERDLDKAASDEDANRDEQAQAPDVPE